MERPSKGDGTRHVIPATQTRTEAVGPVPRATGLASRRKFLQAGFSTALGMELGSFLAARALAESISSIPSAKATKKPTKSVLLVFLTGAPSHIDTFDMKPEAPAEVRGEFQPIATTVPGVFLCEHLPRLASRMEHLAIVRTMTTNPSLASHETGTHAILTGINQLPPGSGLYATRQDWPCYAAGLDFARRRRDGMPSGIHVPDYLAVGGSGYCGQNAGFLGAEHDPWQGKHNLHTSGAVADQSLALKSDLALPRIRDRRTLLAELDSGQSIRSRATAAYTAHQSRVFDLLDSGHLARAFALDQESAATRDRYGRHPFGQGLLMARRVLETGVPLVQANVGVAGQWDTHVNNCKSLKNSLLPPFDMGLTSLLDDLHSSGLLDETLVIVTGEFGRTPRLGGNVGTPSFSPDGRDHWTQCFSSLFIGAGVRGGQVVGSSDRIAAFPTTRAWNPADLGATIYRALGVPPDIEIHDPLNRALPLNAGDPIESVFTGA